MDKTHAGRKGGQATAKRHGKPHMRRIGAQGFSSTVARHSVDRQGYLQWLRRNAYLIAIDRAAGDEIERQLAEGATTVCVEIDFGWQIDDDDIAEIPW